MFIPAGKSVSEWAPIDKFCMAPYRNLRKRVLFGAQSASSVEKSSALALCIERKSAGINIFDWQ